MFRALPRVDEGQVSVFVNGHAFSTRPGDTVAAVLFLSGELACRTTAVSGTLRGPYCLMAACFDCLVTIDGIANMQACAVQVRKGMRIDFQRGARALDEGLHARAI